MATASTPSPEPDPQQEPSTDLWCEGRTRVYVSTKHSVHIIMNPVCGACAGRPPWCLVQLYILIHLILLASRCGHLLSPFLRWGH